MPDARRMFAAPLVVVGIALLAACSAATGSGSPAPGSTDSGAGDPQPSSLDCSQLIAPLHDNSMRLGADVTWSVSVDDVPYLDAAARAASCVMTSGAGQSEMAFVPTSAISMDTYTAALAAAGYTNTIGNWYPPASDTPLSVGASADLVSAGVIPPEVSDIVGDYFFILINKE